MKIKNPSYNEERQHYYLGKALKDRSINVKNQWNNFVSSIKLLFKK